MKQAFRRAAPARQRTGQSVEVADRAGIAASTHWRAAFAHTRKDRRYYEIAEDTLMPQVAHRYFAIRDARGAICAVQPFFLLDQDLLDGTPGWLKKAAAQVRRLWPRFLTMRTLMLGCSAGEAQLDRGPAHWAADAALIAQTIAGHARALGAKLIVLKEFPAQYRDALAAFPAHGFLRFPSLPMAALDLPYRDFDDYLQRGLNARMRSDLRRKFRAADAQMTLSVSVTRDISGSVDELYPLYLQVFDRSDRHFEKLSKDFLCALGRRMPDKVRFFIWRDGGKAVAFSVTMVHDDHICNEYLGLDYDVALDNHLYFVAFRDVVAWAIANGYKRCLTTGLGYAPKLSLGFSLYPLDLYVRHVSDRWNALLRHALPFIEPVRFEPILKRFPNYDALWPAGATPPAAISSPRSSRPAPSSRDCPGSAP